VVPLPFRLPKPETYGEKLKEARGTKERIINRLAGIAEKTENAPPPEEREQNS
jgi:hypothetical protein